MDFLDSIAYYLESQGIGNFTTGSIDIHVGKQRAEPDDSITILGQIGTELPDVSIAELTYPRFQVIVRNTVYEDGSALLRQIRDALHGIIAVDTPNYHIMRLHAQQEGFAIGEDSKGRSEFSINFYGEARYVDS